MSRRKVGRLWQMKVEVEESGVKSRHAFCSSLMSFAQNINYNTCYVPLFTEKYGIVPFLSIFTFCSNLGGDDEAVDYLTFRATPLHAFSKS